MLNFLRNIPTDGLKTRTRTRTIIIINFQFLNSLGNIDTEGKK